jgi:thiosulfate/3-mercaptopyruvate sulfurtransferase
MVASVRYGVVRCKPDQSAVLMFGTLRQLSFTSTEDFVAMHLRQFRFLMLVLLGVLVPIVAPQAASVLVDAAWLESQLKDPNLVVIDMTDEDLQYTRYHIPGAVRLAYSDLLNAPVGKKPPTPLTDHQLAMQLGQLGIARETRLVLYDDMGGLNAGRLFLDLERIGHPAVSVLDGGLVKWVLEGRRVDNTPVLRKPATYTLGTTRRANVATFSDVQRAASKADLVTLLDVRSRDEYTGSPKESRSGHIPQARWWPWEQAIRMDSGFTFHEPEVLLTSLARAEVQDQKRPIILYCRSGHRASQSYLTLRHLGFENVRVYSGSMNEYQMDRSAQLVRGLTP